MDFGAAKQIPKNFQLTRLQYDDFLLLMAASHDSEADRTSVILPLILTLENTTPDIGLPTIAQMTMHRVRRGKPMGFNQIVCSSTQSKNYRLG